MAETPPVETKTPERPLAPDFAADERAAPSPSLVALVSSGLALARGLGIVAGIARVAAPALVGYLAREIVDSLTKGAAADSPEKDSGAAETGSAVPAGEVAPDEPAEKEALPDPLPGSAALHHAVSGAGDAALSPTEADDAPEGRVPRTPDPADEFAASTGEEEVGAIESAADADNPGASPQDEGATGDGQADHGGNHGVLYGLLDLEDPEEVALPFKIKSLPASTLSPFFMVDESDDPPPQSVLGAPHPEAVAVPDAPGMSIQPLGPETTEAGPSIPEFKAETTGAANPQGSQPLPPLDTGALPATPPESHVGLLTPTALTKPAADPAPAGNESDFDLDFDPIAIFLQGREAEGGSPDAPDPEPRDPQAVSTEIDDEPTLDAEPDSGFHEESVPGSASARYPQGGIPAATGVLPHADSADPPAIPPRRASNPDGKESGRSGTPSEPFPLRRGPLAFPSPGVAASTASAPPFPSPFLLAPAAEPVVGPGTEPAAPTTVFPGRRGGKNIRRGKRKTRLLTFVLVGVFAAAAAGAVYLYHNPERNPFAGAKSRGVREPAPLPITPVKPDGSMPALHAHGGGPSPESRPSAPAAAPDAGDASAAPPPPADTVPPVLTDEDFAAIVKDPGRTLATFLSVRSNAERFRLVHQPDGIRERMDAYAATHGEGPISYNGIIPKPTSTVPGTTVPTHLFLVTTPSQPDGFPVSVEETESGFRVDWDAFVQYNDHLLEAFFFSPSALPGPFFVVLRRSHYFGEDVPDLYRKLSYRVLSPISADIERFGFIDAASPAGKEAAKNFDWNRSYRPVVRLEWVREGDAEPYIAITEILRNSWRGTGTDSPPEG